MKLRQNLQPTADELKYKKYQYSQEIAEQSTGEAQGATLWNSEFRKAGMPVETMEPPKKLLQSNGDTPSNGNGGTQQPRPSSQLTESATCECTRVSMSRSDSGIDATREETTSEAVTDAAGEIPRAASTPRNNGDCNVCETSAKCPTRTWHPSGNPLG